MKLGEIAKIIDGKLIGDPETIIASVASIEKAGTGEITWVSHSRYHKWIERTSASCIILSRETDVGLAPADVATIQVVNPFLAIAKLLAEFHSEVAYAKGISPQAHVDKTAEIGKRVSIGAFCYIGSNTIVGNDVVVSPSAYVGNHVRIGDRTRIHPHVSVLDNVVIGSNVQIYSGAVIGSEGFAYTEVGGKHIHIPHCGGVIIEDDVEIGALSAIVRAVLDNTVIKRGTKIDNLVQVAHNVEIGEDSMILAQVAIAGSAEIGKNVIIAGQAGVTDHAVIGNNAVIGGQAGVTKDVPANATVCGYPASPRRQSNLAYSLLMRLPELFKRVSVIEKQCKQR
jgi:UDP-3-O-[3-hydroxymyristoyl] glucosamine N-acyltransferase